MKSACLHCSDRADDEVNEDISDQQLNEAENDSRRTLKRFKLQRTIGGNLVNTAKPIGPRQASLRDALSRGEGTVWPPLEVPLVRDEKAIAN